MKNIIVAGGNGFLGKQFVDFLINKEEFNLHVIDIKKSTSYKKNLKPLMC